MGFFSELFSGKDSAAAALQASGVMAGASEKARHAEVSNIKKGMEAGLGYLSPYAETGGQARDLLADLLGLNGPEASQGAYANFVNPPGFQEAVDYGSQNAMQQRINFGGLRSGATMAALQGVGQRSKYSAVQNWLDRLTGQSSQGVNVAGRQSDISTTGYSNIGRAESQGILGEASAQAGGILGAQSARNAGYGNLANVIGGGINLLAGGMTGGMGGNNLLAGVGGGWGNVKFYPGT